MPLLQSPWTSGLIVTTLGTWILYGAVPGINWALWTFTAACAFGVVRHCSGARLSTEQLMALVVACVLAGVVAVTTSPLVVLLAAGGVLLLAATTTLLSAGLSPPQITAGVLAFTPLSACVMVIAESRARLSALLRGHREVPGHPALRGMGIALPITLAFFLLLSAADPTLAHWRDIVRDALISLRFVPRLVFFVLLGTLVLGALGMATRTTATNSWLLPRPLALKQSLGGVERLIILGGVTAVFALFLFLQVGYLFGNPGSVTGSGLTYAEVVHRGFGELTAAASLCALLIVMLERRALRGERETTVRWLAIALITESLLLLVSAYQRVSWYQDAYGYTTQRLYVRVYMIAAALALAVLCTEVCRQVDVARLTRRIALLAAATIALLGYWNHAAWIARANVARYQQTGQLDASYLGFALGADAVPEVLLLLPTLKAADAEAVRTALQRQRVLWVPQNAPQRWYEWNLRRSAARAAIESAALSAAPSS